MESVQDNEYLYDDYALWLFLASPFGEKCRLLMNSQKISRPKCK